MVGGGFVRVAWEELRITAKKYFRTASSTRKWTVSCSICLRDQRLSRAERKETSSIKYFLEGLGQKKRPD